MAVQGHPRSILVPIESVYESSIATLSYLAPFQRYCSFSAKNSTQTLFHPNFRGPLTIANVDDPKSKDPKLNFRVVTIELT